MREYLCSPKCGLSTTARIGRFLDRAPRPYTAPEIAEITGIPLLQVRGFLQCNSVNDKISSRRVTRATVGMRPGKMIIEYWRGGMGVIDTFTVDNMMDDKTEGRLREGKRPVSWRDGNHTSWSIDEGDNVATMRGSSVVRLGKVESVSFAKTGVTVAVNNGIRVTFRRA